MCTREKWGPHIASSESSTFLRAFPVCSHIWYWKCLRWWLYPSSIQTEFSMATTGWILTILTSTGFIKSPTLNYSKYMLTQPNCLPHKVTDHQPDESQHWQSKLVEGKDWSHSFANIQKNNVPFRPTLSLLHQTSFHIWECVWSNRHSNIVVALL